MWSRMFTACEILSISSFQSISFSSMWYALLFPSEMLTEVDSLLSEAKKALNILKDVEAKASAISDAKEQAFYYKDTVKEAMQALRTPIDQLEMIVDSTVWPIPTYGELMFEV